MQRLSKFAGALALVATVGASSSFALSFDQNVTSNAIFGSGNTNGSFTIDQSNGVELGLRGKLRHNAAGAPENTFNSNGDGTYSFAAGVAPTQALPTAVWSFEWSINTDFLGTSGMKLDDYTFVLDLDIDPTQGINFFSFDPINAVNPQFGEVRWDHSMGDNSTAQGAGVEAGNAVDYATNLGLYNLAQNSWKPSWFIPGFNPTLDGTYNLGLAAFDRSGAQLARTDIQIIVGQGGAAVPDSGATFALAGLALLGLAGFRRRFSK